jgi:hypothetical protein
MFVIKRDDVTLVGESLHVRRHEMGADERIAGDQRRAFGQGTGEHLERRAQSDGGLRGHPGQLSPADHADDGHAGPGLARDRAGRGGGPVRPGSAGTAGAPGYGIGFWGRWRRRGRKHAV